MLTVYTFGDSTLDCSHYNDKGVDPGRLIVNNHDQLFPEFRGRDLFSKDEETVTDLRAYDGSVVGGLIEQIEDLEVEGPAIALLTIGGNDLRQSLADGGDFGAEEFAQSLKRFLDQLPVRPVLIATVYDPSFGDDSLQFFGPDQARGRDILRQINALLSHFGQAYGASVDLHGHFLQGQPDWLTDAFEPSLIGTSEIRRCFLDAIEANGFA